MLGLIKRLFGSTTPPATATKDPAPAPVSNTIAPALEAETKTKPETDADTNSSDSNERAFICRTPLLDRHEHIAGYEFSLKRSLQTRLQSRSPSAQRAYDDVLLRALVAAQRGSAGQRPGQGLLLIELSVHSLANPLLNALPTERSVVLLDSQAALTLADDARQSLDAQLANLQTSGLRHGWKLHPTTLPQAGQLSAAHFIQLEPDALNKTPSETPNAPNAPNASTLPITLPTLLTLLRQNASAAQPAAQPPQFIASQLQTHADFTASRQASFDYFHGSFITSREHWQAPKSDINRLRVIELLNLLRSDAAITDIAECLKTEPVLTFKLLRYINSPALGLQREIPNLAQGLVVLGRDKFYRWLSLLLFDSRDPGYRERMLTEQALTRAHFLEGLAGQGQITATPDQLFMTGMFSLLDTLMGKPMSEMLAQVTLPDTVRAALLGEPGITRSALELLLALENHDTEQIAAATDRCGLSDAQVSQIMIEALAWAQSINSTDAEPT